MDEELKEAREWIRKNFNGDEICESGNIGFFADMLLAYHRHREEEMQPRAILPELMGLKVMVTKFVRDDTVYISENTLKKLMVSPQPPKE